MFKSGKQKTPPQTHTSQPEIPAKISQKTKAKKAKVQKKSKETLNLRQLDVLLTLFAHPFLSEKTMLGFVNLKHNVNASTMRRDLNRLSKLEYLVHAGGRITYTKKGLAVVEKQFAVPQLYNINDSASAYHIGAKMAEIELFFLQNNYPFYLGGLCSFLFKQKVSITNIEIGNQQQEVDAVFALSNAKESVLFFVHFFNNPFQFPSLARSYFRKTSQKIYRFKSFSLCAQDKSKFDALFSCSITKIQSIIIVEPSSEKYMPANLDFCRTLTMETFKTINWDGVL